MHASLFKTLQESVSFNHKQQNNRKKKKAELTVLSNIWVRRAGGQAATAAAASCRFRGTGGSDSGTMPSWPPSPLDDRPWWRGEPSSDRLLIAGETVVVWRLCRVDSSWRVLRGVALGGILGNTGIVWLSEYIPLSGLLKPSTCSWAATLGALLTNKDFGRLWARGTFIPFFGA